jgi:hypothetical protein
MKLQTWFAGAAIAAAISGAGAAQAQCVGNCGTDGADGVVTLSPTGNSSYGYVSTFGGATGAGEIAGQTGITSTDGSQLTSSVFTANAGDPLTLYFNFITSDGSGFPDYAFAELQTAAGAHVAWLFTAATEPSGNTSPGQGLNVGGVPIVNSSTLTPPTSGIIAGGPVWSKLGGSSGTCFDVGCGYTGWIQSTFDIVTPGSYKVEFGVSNVNDTIFDTGLAFDGLADNGVPVPTGAVPEPATWAMMLLGLGALGAMLRTARRSGLPVAA